MVCYKDTSIIHTNIFIMKLNNSVCRLLWCFDTITGVVGSFFFFHCVYRAQCVWVCFFARSIVSNNNCLSSSSSLLLLLFSLLLLLFRFVLVLVHFNSLCFSHIAILFSGDFLSSLENKHTYDNVYMSTPCYVYANKTQTSVKRRRRREFSTKLWVKEWPCRGKQTHTSTHSRTQANKQKHTTTFLLFTF